MGEAGKDQQGPFLYVVVCAAGNAGGVGTLIAAAQDRGWAVGVVATPLAMRFIDAAAVETRTGYPIRSAWRLPGEPRPLPPPDAIAVAPATFNTVNKWAAGLADTLALGILCEAYGLGVPTAVLPYVNAAMARHPAYEQSLDRLRDMGVLVGSAPPHPPNASEEAAAFPWEQPLDLLDAARRSGR
ncbi:flavoprotein [Actinacidiphila acidipaludis]|uniref:Flavoprotein n=1 Tax=Actinacidiphila acidipaludis TaxID=2873382 RepID=A0ABS7Q743_9ACTN|nr:flavoprotein [Streptomyces acidipaludis]MBY8878964.1 flavoprotein [Streptomyces acidipaludis]